MNNNMTNKWNLIKLEEITEQTNFRNKQNAKHIVLSVTNSQGLIPSEKYFDKQVYSKDVTTYKIIKKGEIAYNPSRINVGSIALLNNYEMALVSPLYITLKTKKILEPRYLIHYLKSDKGIALIQHFTSGSVRDSLKYKSFGKIRIPLPPLETQKKIADVLDKAQELIDKRKKQIELLDEFLQSVFIDMFGDPVTNPNGFSTVTLENIGTWQSGGTPARNNPKFYNGIIPWITSGELESMYIEDSIEKISEEGLLNSAAKKIPVGSLLLGMYDTAALKSSINKVECSCNQAIAFAKLDSKKVNTLYVYFNIQIGKDYYKRFQRGIRQQNLNLSMIKSINLMCPPIDLQNKFAEIVQATEKQRELMKKSLEEMENNFNSISQKAFRGELFS